MYSQYHSYYMQYKIYAHQKNANKFLADKHSSDVETFFANF